MTRFAAAAVAALLLAAASAPLAQDRPDRSRPPALGPAPDLNLPPVQKRTLGNGLQVLFVEQHEVPLVQVNLLLRAGSAADPAGKFGLASLTAAMLDEGAAGRTALQIADELEFLGAVLTAGSSFDSSTLRLNVPVARLPQALPVMADVALRPSFPREDLDRVRQERLTDLMQARDDGARVAPLAFSRLVYGAAHRYGIAEVGTESTLKSFTADDLRAFHEAHYRPSNATLIVVGDAQPEAVLPSLEAAFGGWKGASASRVGPLPAVGKAPARQVHIVDMPGAAQSQVRIGWIGAPRSTPDYFSLGVLNTVLGGSFTSRLNQNLREKHGYAYGAGSRFDMRLEAGPFFAAAGVQTDKTSEALREFFNELTAIRQRVDATELAKAKNYLALGFPGQLETIGDLAARLEELIVYNLPENYFERYIANIQAVTSEDVERVASTFVQPDRFVVVVVGDRKVIEPGIRALGLGPVRVLSVAEALGS